MATDITTLAIALQSKEAENSLKTFNELLVSGSKNAERMERLPIGVDVNAAMRELSAFKASYEDIAKTAGDIHFDIGMNMPTKLTPPPIEPSVDATALNELRAIFKQTNEEIQRETEGVSQSISKMGSEAARASEAVRASADGTAMAAQSAKEHSAAIRELAAAQKKMESASLQAAQAEQKASDASQRAAEIKKQLTEISRQRNALLAEEASSKQNGGNLDDSRAQKIKAMAQEVTGLRLAYEEAQAEADKFALKLQTTAAKADEARMRYEAAKAAVENVSAPTIQVPTVNTSSYEALRDFFLNTAAELRQQSDIVTESLKKIGVGTEQAGTAILASAETMRKATASTGEYSVKLLEATEAQKDFEIHIAQAESNMLSSITIDGKAAEAKWNLAKAETELNRITEQTGKTKFGNPAEIETLTVRQNALKQEVQSLSVTFNKAQFEADSFGAKLELSAGKADQARVRFEAAKQSMVSMQVPPIRVPDIEIPPIKIPSIEMPVIQLPVIDTTTLDNLKVSFVNTSEELRKQAEAISVSMSVLANDSERSGAAVRMSGEFMKTATASASEYAAKLQEVSASKKELETYAAKEAADMSASVEADRKAAESKQNLIRTQQELNRVSEQLAKTPSVDTSGIEELRIREESLKKEVQRLSTEYQNAQAESNRFGTELEQSAARAEEARTKYDAVRKSLDTLSVPRTISVQVPAIQVPHIEIPVVNIPRIDTSTIDEMKAKYVETSEEIRIKTELISETMANMGGTVTNAAESVRASMENIRGTTDATTEYAAKIRELNAAQQEMQQAIAQSDAAMQNSLAADQRAAAIKRDLTAAQNELKAAQEQWATASKGGEDTTAASARIETLKQQVSALTRAYTEAQAQSDQFGLKLDAATAKADELTAHYNAAKAAIESMMMPNVQTTPMVQSPEIDTTAIDNFKAKYAETTTDVAEKTQLVKESMETIGTSAARAATTIQSSGAAMKETSVSAEEYASMLTEVNAALAEKEKYAARADAAALAAQAAEKIVVDTKRELVRAENELKQVTSEIETIRKGGSGSVEKLTAREAVLRNEIERLAEAYRRAREQADKLAQRHNFSASIAEEASQKYNMMRTEIEGVQKPVENAGHSMGNFNKKMKTAGTTATKIARGFNAVAFAGGATIPGLTRLGMAISMFSYSGPYIGAAVVGFGALAIAIKKIRESIQNESKYIKENAERAMKMAQEAKKLVSESENDWTRLGELSGVGELTNTQNQEATAIIQRLTEVYGDLGIEIDKTTGKLTGYLQARIEASKQERAIQEETLRFAQVQAEREQKNQLEKLEKNIKPGFLKGDQIAFKGMTESLAKSIKDQNKSELEIVKEFNQNKERLQRIISGDEKLTFQVEHTDFQGMKSYTTGTVSKDTAMEQLKQIEELEKAWKDANDAKKAYDKYKTKPVEEYSKEVGKLAKTLKESESKFAVDENGEKRLKTNEEVYNEQKKQLESLNDEIQRLQAGINYDNTKNIENITKLENEKLELIKETLAYENRVTDEKKRQADADRKMNEAAKSLSDTNVNLFKQQGEKLMSMLTDKNASEADIMDEFEKMIAKVEQIKTGKATVSDYTKFEYIPEQKDFRGAKDARFLGDIDQKSAEAYSQTLKKVKADFEALNQEKNRLENLSTLNADDLYKEQKRRIDEIATEIEKETAASLQHIDEMAIQENGKQAGAYLIELQTERNNLLEKTLNYEKRLAEEKEKQAEADRKTIEAAQKQLKAAEESYLLDKNAKIVREKNADEKAADRQTEINELKKQIKSLSASAMRRDATAEDLLEWGKRYNPETGKMNGAQKQAGWRGVLSDRKGGVMTEVSVGTEINGKEVEIPLIIPDSTESDLVRIAKIANGEMTKVPDDLMEKAVDFAKKRLAEGKSPFFNGDKEDEALRNVNVDAEGFAKLADAQSNLLKMLAEQGKYTEAVKTAQAANADKFKDYMFDKSGAVLRKKTDEELRASRQKQIKDEMKEARNRLKASEKGTLEYEDARAKLTELEIESYNLRKKTNAATLMQNARTENTRMVRGIEARSAEALALESRIFRRDDSEKAILKDTKDVQTDIRDTLNKVSETVTSLGAAFINLDGILQPV